MASAIAVATASASDSVRCRVCPSGTGLTGAAVGFGGWKGVRPSGRLDLCLPLKGDIGGEVGCPISAEEEVALDTSVPIVDAEGRRWTSGGGDPARGGRRVRGGGSDEGRGRQALAHLPFFLGTSAWASELGSAELARGL